MTHRLLFMLVALMALSFSGVRAADPVRVPVFEMNTYGSKYYRIPALAVAADGSLIAVADRRGDALNDLPNTISVVVRRSVDNGDTWSDPVVLAEGNKTAGKSYGDPAVVVDRESGTILVLFCGDKGFWDSRNPVSQRQGLYMVKSTDNGLTWSEPVRFDSQIYKQNWQGGFIASGTALQLSSGGIMCVVNAHTSTSPGYNQEQYAIWTDDLGDTWHAGARSATPSGNGNESKLIERENGDIVMSIRCSGTRMYAVSTDGGDTWGPLSRWNDMQAADCNGDILRYSSSSDGRSRILHSVPNSSIRENVSVFLSYDEADTWPVKKTLCKGVSAYSSLAVLPGGEIGCLVEEGKWDSNLPGDDGFTLAFYRFTLDWLTDGADNPTSVTSISGSSDSVNPFISISDDSLLSEEISLYTLGGLPVDPSSAPAGLYILRNTSSSRLVRLPR